jgi:8-oxo-dGTP pyrophosphatase MutT (NUDIX family)
MADPFRVTAKALLYFGDKVLLIKRPEGGWDLPGGRLEPGEQPEAALVREISEEIGITAKIGALVDCALRHRPGDIDVFVLSYLCTTKAAFGDIRLSHEHVEAGLFGRDKVEDLDMVGTYKEAVELGFKRRGKGAVALGPEAEKAWRFLLKTQAFQPS